MKRRTRKAGRVCQSEESLGGPEGVGENENLSAMLCSVSIGRKKGRKRGLQEGDGEEEV